MAAIFSSMRLRQYPPLRYPHAPLPPRMPPKSILESTSNPIACHQPINGPLKSSGTSQFQSDITTYPNTRTAAATNNVILTAFNTYHFFILFFFNCLLVHHIFPAAAHEERALHNVCAK